MNTVFDYLGQRILSFYPEIKNYVDNGVFPRPRFLILYPTNICSFKCTFCDYKELNSLGKVFLKRFEWEYILNEFKNAGGQAVELCGGGEPLNCPDIYSLLEYIKSRSLHLGVLTNGICLVDSSIANFLGKNASYVRISFESGSPEMFEKIKGVKGINYINIINSAGEMIKRKRDDCQVSYKYTIGKEVDIIDIEIAIRNAEDFGFDSIQFKLAANVPEAFTDDRIRLTEKIEYLAEKYLHHTVLLTNFLKINLPQRVGCFTSVVHTLIDYYGDIYICCYYRHRMDTHCIGNIFKSGFQSVWNSYEHWKKQKGINCNDCNLYDCRFIKYNLMMESALQNGQLDFI